MNQTTGLMRQMASKGDARAHGSMMRACSSLLSFLFFALLFGSMFALPPCGRAQVSGPGEKQMGEPADDRLPAVLSKAGITQELNEQLPLGATFRDDTGRTVKLGDYFDGRRPAILAMVYYQCPILCSEELKGLTGALEMVNLRPGKDFQIVVISIDPKEGPALAHAKKVEYLKYYGRPETAAGWHFLTGDAANIHAVAEATGFGFTPMPGPDGKMNQFAHSSALEIITPEGRIAQYYLGLEYSPNDLRLGLVEASAHRIGSPVDNLLTYCYRYDPAINRHSMVVARVVQLGCLLTMLGLGSYMLVMFRRDARRDRGVTGRGVSGQTVAGSGVSRSIRTAHDVIRQ